MKPNPGTAADTSPSNAERPMPKEGVSVTHLLIVRDVARSGRFYSDEIRCYLFDPDGHLIELGQAKQTGEPQ